MDQSASVQELIDTQRCTELVYRFARGIDRMDEDLIRSVFHPDATDDHGMFRGTAQDFVPWVMKTLAGLDRTQHCVSNVLIELDGDTAYGESYFVAHHKLKKDGADIYYISAGRYCDRFERRGGVWKIVHRLAVYDWSEETPSTNPWARAYTGPGERTLGRRDRLDASYLR